MKIILAGGTGYLGSVLIDHFSKNTDNQIYILSRKHIADTPQAKYLYWDGKNMGSWVKELEEADVLINLSGKSVNCRYTETNMNAIYQSRLDSTSILGKAIQQCKNPPKVWINLSSATIYEHSLDVPHTENSTHIGNDFSMDVCKKWEHCFNSFILPSTKKVILRSAIVMGNRSGSALKRLKNIVLWGLGGKMASGKQMISWIGEEDFARAIEFIIDKKKEGVYNLSAPMPITNKEFMSILREKMKISFGIDQPKWILILGTKIIGTEAELILKSRYVVPQRLTNEGFEFSWPRFEHISLE